MKASEIALDLLGGMLCMFLIFFCVMALYVISPDQSGVHSETVISGKGQ